MVSSLKRFKISIIVAIMVIFCAGVAFAEEDTATLAILIGTVEICPGGTDLWEDAAEGMTLSAGDKIRTGIDGMLSIQFSNGSLVSLKPNTEFQVQTLNISEDKKDIDYELQLTRGRLRAIVEELGDDSTFEIKTPTAVAAVRGTTFYLNVREMTEDELPPDVKEQLMTELFVEVGGVIYTNTLSGKYYAVSASETSGSYGDGSITVPLEIPEDKKQEWIEGWDILAAEPYQEPGGGEPGPGGGGGGETKDDAERQSNQLRDILEDIYQADEADLVWQEIVKRLLELKEHEELNEIAFLRSEIRDILVANRERRVEGYIEKIADAQRGKYLIDVHGRRVRMEQYVLRPANENNIVEILNVNLRGGVKGGDLSAMQWITEFDSPLDVLSPGELKTLPWDRYLYTRYSEDGTPSFIYSPEQPHSIYPSAMSVKFSHRGDSFAESRKFLERRNEFNNIFSFEGVQPITEPQLWVSNFNNNEWMSYAAPESPQPPGTYSIEQNLRIATIGGSESNPTGFRYNFRSGSDYGGIAGSIDAAFYVISGEIGVSSRLDGYSELALNDVWAALGANTAVDRQIGSNYLEMIFTSPSATIFPAGPIDLIYTPLPNMEWVGDEILPPSLSE